MNHHKNKIKNVNRKKTKLIQATVWCYRMATLSTCENKMVFPQTLRRIIYGMVHRTNKVSFKFIHDSPELLIGRRRGHPVIVLASCT